MNLIRHPATARIVPFAIYILFLPLGQIAAGAFPGADLRPLYGIQVGLTALALIYFWRQYGELHVRSAIRGWDVLFATGIGIAVFVLWISLDHPLFLLGEMGGGFDPRNDGRVDWALASVRVLGASLIVPVMEELFWRSFLARWVDRPSFLEQPPQRISLKAIGLTSCLFAVEHTPWFAGLLAGIAYACLYRRTGNLWVPVMSHMVTNFILAVWVLRTESWQYW